MVFSSPSRRNQRLGEGGAVEIWGDTSSASHTSARMSIQTDYPPSTKIEKHKSLSNSSAPQNLRCQQVKLRYFNSRARVVFTGFKFHYIYAEHFIFLSLQRDHFIELRSGEMMQMSVTLRTHHFRGLTVKSGLFAWKCTFLHCDCGEDLSTVTQSQFMMSTGKGPKLCFYFNTEPFLLILVTEQQRGPLSAAPLYDWWGFRRFPLKCCLIRQSNVSETLR